jgi:hypothetical protein
MITIKDIAIIIPLKKGEHAWKGLVQDFKYLEPQTEIIFVGPDSEDNLLGSTCLELKKTYPLSRYVMTSGDRAQKLNKGARAATKKYVWFLHADSRFSKDTVKQLEKSINKEPRALHYFDLSYLPDGPQMMFVNELACFLRSHLFNIPFGDQGFCLRKDILFSLGGFPETVAFGEDNLLIHQAKKDGVKVKCTNGIIETSSRRYKEGGWLRVTGSMTKQWTKQVWELRKRN